MMTWTFSIGPNFEMASSRNECSRTHRHFPSIQAEPQPTLPPPHLNNSMRLLVLQKEIPKSVIIRQNEIMYVKVFCDLESSLQIPVVETKLKKK